MIRLILLIAILGGALIVWNKIQTAGPRERKKIITTSILSVLGIVLALLALTGHLSLITAAIAGLLAFIPRLLQYTRYLPLFQRTFQQQSQQQNQQQHHRATTKQGMNRQQAYDVLGLKAGCSREEIIRAHKRMMQKVHPDRGGSDYLAAQINQAKDILLG